VGGVSGSALRREPDLRNYKKGGSEGIRMTGIAAINEEPTRWVGYKVTLMR
jgi:hypothetical protein